MFGSSYNAPRLHVAIEARKIVISGEVAGLQIQLGPPAVPGRFDSCDLPPKFLSYSSHLPYFLCSKGFHDSRPKLSFPAGNYAQLV